MKNSISFINEVLKKKPRKMANENENVQALIEQIQEITAQFQASELKREEMEKRIDDMGVNGRETFELGIPCDEPDIETEITSGDQIQLELFRAIPEYNGRRYEYRSWRNQVSRSMKMIDDFKTHPKYGAALSIIRAKITGAAADILVNNKTPFNIICILRTLDSAYTDQRPH